jgi:hypothetical protein
MRGAAVSVEKLPFGATLFVSSRNLAASVDNGEMTSLDETGLNYGDPEYVKETVLGAKFQAQGYGILKGGVSGVFTTYSIPFVKGTNEKDLNDPQGDEFAHLSVDGEISIERTELFFEHASMNLKESATIAGILLAPGNFKATAVYRYYTPGYYSFRSGSFSAFGKTSNETGIYISGNWRHKGLETGFTRDLARTISRTYLEPMPVLRERLHGYCKLSNFKEISLRTDFRYTKDSSSQVYRSSYKIGMEKKERTRQLFRWKTGFAMTKGGGESGLFVEAGVWSGIKNKKLQIILFSFDIPNWDARYYMSMPYIPGNGGTTAVWGRGMGFSSSLRYKTISARWTVMNSDQSRSRELLLQADESF